ncbi:lipoate protein ligase C-terminal domain-containing protein, partial [Pseudomonas marginalis]
FNIEKGVISDCQIFTDSLDPSPLEWLSQHLYGQTYQVDTVRALTQQMYQQWPDLRSQLVELEAWLIQQVS